MSTNCMNTRAAAAAAAAAVVMVVMMVVIIFTGLLVVFLPCFALSTRMLLLPPLQLRHHGCCFC